MLLNYLFGDDIFISYTRADAVNYAAALANRLASRDFSCFLDQWGSPPARELPKPLKRALGRSAVLVLIGSESVVSSRPVEAEVAAFVKTGRTIIPIDVDGALEKAAWYPLIAGLARTPETKKALHEGHPAPDIIRRIEDSFHFTRRNRRVRRTFAAAAGFLLVLVCASVYAAVAAKREQRAAEDFKHRAESAANKAREQEELARASAQRAKSFETAATANARIAEQREREALRNAEQARQQQRLAEERGKIAGSRELAANAVAQLNVDPELSILLAREAARISLPPTAEAEQALRQALLESHLRAVIGGPPDLARAAVFGPGGKPLFLTIRNKTEATLWEGSIQRSRFDLGRRVFDVALSADGARLLVRDDRGKVQVWATAIGRKVTDLAEARGARAAAISEHGRRIATVEDDGMVHIWDVDGERQLAACPGGGYNPVFSPDERLLAIQSGDRALRICDAASGQIVLDYPEAAGMVVFSPDSKLVANHVLEGDAVVRDVSNPERRIYLGRHYSTGVVFSPDAKKAITTSRDEPATIWDLSESAKPLELVGHFGPVNDAAFSASGRWVFTSSSDGTARLWDVSTGQTITILSGHKGSVRRVLSSPDEKTVLTLGEDGTARLWESAQGNSVLDLRHDRDSVNSAVFSPDGKLVLTAGADHTARIWDANTGLLITSIPHRSAVSNAVFSPDARFILTHDQYGGFIWDVKGKLLAEASWRTSGNAFSPDGKVVLVVHDRAEVRDTATNRMLLQLGLPPTVRGGFNAVNAMFAPDGKRILVEDATGALLIFDSATGAFVSRRPQKLPASPAFSPDGRKILNRSGWQLRVWSWADPPDRNPSPFDRPTAFHYFDAGFSPDGTKIVTANEVGSAQVWDVATGSEVLALRGHRGFLTSAAYSPSGRWILTASSDGTARVWDVQSGRTLMTLGRYGGVHSAAFSPDGKRVVTAEANGAARIYSCEVCVPVEELLSLAERRLTRGFMPEERKMFLH